MKCEIDKKANEIVIRLPMTAPTPSKTGKSLTVASSHGNQATTATIDGKPVYVGVNCYVRA